MYDLKTYDLYGKVKTVKENRYELKKIRDSDEFYPGSDNNMHFMGYECYSFNINGQILELTKHDNERKILSKHEFIYTEDGRLLEDINHGIDAVYRSKHLYNSEGVNIGFDEYLCSPEIGLNNHIPESIKLWTSLYTFDNYGRFTGSKYTTEGKVSYSTEYTLNDNGDVIELKHAFEGRIQSRNKSKYNEENAEIERIWINNYDRILSICRYDNLHNLTEEIFYGSDGLIIKHRKFSYLFDKHKNWVKRVEHEDSLLVRKSHRIIAYYSAD